MVLVPADTEEITDRALYSQALPYRPSTSADGVSPFPRWCQPDMLDAAGSINVRDRKYLSRLDNDKGIDFPSLSQITSGILCEAVFEFTHPTLSFLTRIIFR